MKRKSEEHTIRLRRGIYLLPNLFTTAALFAGFYAVIVAMRGDFQSAAIAILVAMVLDGLDGRVARMTNTETDFGKEYDSMSDMVSFGLAPALVVYQWGVQSMALEIPAWGRLGWLAAFFYTAAAALRLARFNSQSESKNKHYFQGLPSPSAAGLVGSAVWLVTEYQLYGPVVMAGAYALTVITGALMVSNFPFRSFKDFDLVSRVGFKHLLLIPLFFMIVAVNPPVILTALFMLYGVSGPLLYTWKKLRGRPMELPPILWFSDLKKRNEFDDRPAARKKSERGSATGTDEY